MPGAAQATLFVKEPSPNQRATALPAEWWRNEIDGGHGLELYLESTLQVALESDQIHSLRVSLSGLHHHVRLGQVPPPPNAVAPGAVAPRRPPQGAR